MGPKRVPDTKTDRPTDCRSQNQLNSIPQYLHLFSLYTRKISFCSYFSIKYGARVIYYILNDMTHLVLFLYRLKTPNCLNGAMTIADYGSVWVLLYCMLVFTMYFGLHGHLQVCRILRIFIFICLRILLRCLFYAVTLVMFSTAQEENTNGKHDECGHKV
jgi:type IV secretory pathway VirB6-like protein